MVIIYPNSYERFTQTEIRSSWESVYTLLRITRLAHNKSHLQNFCPNSYEKLTQTEIRLSWSQLKHCSKSLIWPLKLYLVIIIPYSHDS